MDKIDLPSGSPPSVAYDAPNGNGLEKIMEFTRGDVKFQREIFVSAPDEAIVMRLTADRRGQINFEANLDRPERFVTVADGVMSADDRGDDERGRGRRREIRRAPAGAESWR